MILYSILVYILLFTQAPIPVCLDGTIIDSSTILVTCITVVMLGYDWWLCMVINISVRSGFVFIAFVMCITTTMCDGVLHRLWFVFNVFLVSLHGD